MKVLIPFYSLYGHIYQMAQAVAEGAAQVNGSRVTMNWMQLDFRVIMSRQLPKNSQDNKKNNLKMIRGG
jgi:hypothetical protein